MVQLSKNKKWLIYIRDIIKNALRGVSQVILISNSFSGFLILVGIFFISLELGFVVSFVAIISSILGFLLSKKQDEMKEGIFVFNSVLTAIALTVLIQSNVYIVIFGSTLACIFTITWVAKTKIPVLTFPFVIVTWIIMLFTMSNNQLYEDPILIDIDRPPYNEFYTLEVLINGISQVYISENLVLGILIIVALLVEGFNFFIIASLGTIIGCIAALFFNYDIQLIMQGLFGYNAVLTLLALTIVFNKSVWIGAFGSITSVVIMGGLTSVLNNLQIPAFTMPFIIATWIILYATHKYNLTFKGGDQDVTG